MHRKLLTLLVSACALAAVMVVSATASAATLGVYAYGPGPGGLDPYTENVYFESDTTTVSFGSFPAQCGSFSFWTDITQNDANPVTLSLVSSPQAPALVGCPSGISYSNIQATGPVQFNANAIAYSGQPGTGTLPLRVTEQFGGVSCVREGTLNLTYKADQDGYGDTFGGSPVTFDGYLNKVSGGACINSARFQGTFGGKYSSVGPTNENDVHIEWIITP
jgi:hypothetical protein